MDDGNIDFGPRKMVARTLARNLVKDMKIAEAPISLQKVIEFLQKKRELLIQRYGFGDKVSGLLITCRREDDEYATKEYATIIFNENHPWYRRRFTIAHEIGHLLLEHTCTGEENGNHFEIEANNFAAELLIPRKILKKDFSKIQSVPELSKLYRVSQRALAIKIMDARLLAAND